MDEQRLTGEGRGARMSAVAYPHGNQAAQDRYLRDIKPGWSLYQGGLGSGKTWSSARKFRYLHGLNQCPGLAIAPTYGDLWRFVVPALAAAFDEVHWSYSITRNGVPQIECGGQPIYLISAEHPERFAGFEVGHLWIDEGARIRSSNEDPLRDAPTQIRSRLRHPRARVLHGMVSTTPEGVDTWVQRSGSTPRCRGIGRMSAQRSPTRRCRWGTSTASRHRCPRS